MGGRRRVAGAAAALVVVVVALVAAALVLRLGPFGGASGGVAGPVPRFVDETAASGLGFTYDGPFMFAVGGGVAVFDCDADGRQDVYLAGGAGPAALFRNDSPTGGELRFTRLADPATDLAAVNGAYPLDVDGDGTTDLITLRAGENVALRGLGGCRFERANEAWGLDGGGEMTEAFSATWERGGSWPTLAFGNYLEPGNSDPDTRCQGNVLMRPAANTGAGAGGGAAPAYAPALLLEPGYCTLSMLFSDWSGDGRADLRVSNDRAYYRQAEGQEQLWRIEPGEPPRLYGAADGWARVQVEGMGIASHDLTGNGRPEVYLTSQAASKLQTLAEGATGPAYVDIGLARGVNVAHPFTGRDVSLPSTAWHPEFDDVNNDGLMDLFVSKGNTTEAPDFAREDPSNLLLGQPDGTFVEAADRAGIVIMDRGRGAALVDLNLDGALDLIESFYGAPARVWRNTAVPTSGGRELPARWLQLRVTQPGTNRGAIGAVVEVRAGSLLIRRELTVGGGHAGGELGWVHFGLGAADSVEVRVTWPDGAVGAWLPVGPDGFAIVDRVSGVTRWTPPAS